MAKITIIVPVYNVEKYLDRCVHSLINQTLKDLEIILVDDQSPDNCPMLCDAYAARDSRIKVVHKQNGGLGYARNSGLEVANGEYVTFCDSDDCVEYNTYEFCAKIADRHNLDVVRFNCDRFTNDVPKNFFTKTYEICDDINVMRQYAISTWGPIIDSEDKTSKVANIGSSCMGVYRRTFLVENGLKFKSERTILSEDYEFNYNVYIHAKRIGLTGNVFYHYFVNPYSLTTATKNNQVDRSIEFSTLMTENMLRDGYSREIAEVQPMAYVITWLRTQQKYVMLSSSSISEKRAWLEEHIKKQYIQQIKKRYPLAYLEKKYQLSFWLSSNNCFWLSYLLVKLKG